MSADLQSLLNRKVKEFNGRDFIIDDPISIPHRFTLKQDIEITAFWTSMLAWGLRKTIINKCTELFELMDNAPYEFICHHQESDLKPFVAFKHRTFNATDTLYFLKFLQHHYSHSDSLETAFSDHLNKSDDTVEGALIGFHNYFFSLADAPQRTRKHVATPERKSSCKRLNMFLRWMVRSHGDVDFGLWKKIKPRQLICPLDVHVERVARSLGLLERKQVDWLAAVELTNRLKVFDSSDPVKYDFALFGMGVMEKQKAITTK